VKCDFPSAAAHAPHLVLKKFEVLPSGDWASDWTIDWSPPW
jgi:hypothetical protein